MSADSVSMASEASSVPAGAGDGGGRRVFTIGKHRCSGQFPRGLAARERGPSCARVCMAAGLPAASSVLGGPHVRAPLHHANNSRAVLSRQIEAVS